MGKKERAPLAALFLLIGLVSCSCAWKIETVYEDDPPSPVVNTFFDPKFHDTKADSVAVESNIHESSNVIIPSQGDISFTTVQNPQQDDDHQSSSSFYLPSSSLSAPSTTSSSSSFASPSIFQTGSFQEFHEVLPDSAGDQSFKKQSPVFKGVEVKNSMFTESKPLLEPVTHITNPVPRPSPTSLAIPSSSSSSDVIKDDASNDVDVGGANDPPPSVIYAPDGWAPNALTFPEADTTYTKPLSSSPVVKWPGEEDSIRIKANNEDIVLQMYDYVEPAISPSITNVASTTTEPKGLHYIQHQVLHHHHHHQHKVPSSSIASSSSAPSSASVPSSLPVSQQYQYYSTPIPTHAPKGFHFHISHSPMLNSIGNLLSSIPLFRNLPRISFSTGAGVRAHPPLSSQPQTPTIPTVLKARPEQPEIQQQHYHHSAEQSTANTPAGSAGGYIYQSDGGIYDYPSAAPAVEGQPQPEEIYGVGMKDIGGFYSGGQPNVQYGHQPPSLTQSYRVVNRPSTLGYGLPAQEPTYPSTGYTTGHGTNHHNSGYETYLPRPSPSYGTIMSQPQQATYKAVGHFATLLPSILKGNRVQSSSSTSYHPKGSLTSHYASSSSSGEEQEVLLNLDAFQDVGEDVPSTSYGIPSTKPNAGKPLKSFYTSAEQYNAILHGGQQSTPSTKYGDLLFSNGPPTYSSGYGISSYRSPSTVRMPYGATKNPGSISDEFLMSLQTSYGTPKDLKRPSTLGYYRTPMGSWVRMPMPHHMKKGSSPNYYNYKYKTTQQMPIMELDPLLLDLPEEDEEQLPIATAGYDCENKRDCGMSNEFYGNVDITRKPKGHYLSTAMLNRLLKERRRRPGHHNRLRPKGRRNRKGRRSRCRRRKLCPNY